MEVAAEFVHRVSWLQLRDRPLTNHNCAGSPTAYDALCRSRQLCLTAVKYPWPTACVAVIDANEVCRPT